MSATAIRASPRWSEAAIRSSGAGKPTLHTALAKAASRCLGVEVDKERWQVSLLNLFHILRHPETAPRTTQCVSLLHGDASALPSLEPVTHAYAFDLAFPPPVVR